MRATAASGGESRAAVRAPAETLGNAPGRDPPSEASKAPDLIQSAGSPPPPGSPLWAHHRQEGVEEGGAACRVNFNLLD